MSVFDKEYLLKTIEEYNKNIKEKTIGEYKIKKIKNIDILNKAYGYENHYDEKVESVSLEYSDSNIMNIDALEIQGSYLSIIRAFGVVGIVGLGLGYIVQELLKKDLVEQIIVYETSSEVIELYYSNFDKNEKVKIINIDAYDASHRDFDFFYVDIYNYDFTEKIAYDYVFFNTLHNIEEYSFWGVERFLLSCTSLDDIWEYLPYSWVDMSRQIYYELINIDKISEYKVLDEDKVEFILNSFKEKMDSLRKTPLKV